MGEYFKFSGRLNRKPYWLRTLAIYAVILVVFLIAGLLAGGAGPVAGGGMSAVQMVVFAIAGIVALVAIIASIALQVRRLHDRNKSGWWLVFFAIVPTLIQLGFAIPGDPTLALVGIGISLIISIWYLVEIGFLRGTDGPNRFGHDPLKGPMNADVFN